MSEYALKAKTATLFGLSGKYSKIPIIRITFGTVQKWS